MFVLLFAVLISQVNSNTVCDWCLCSFNNKSASEFEGEIVDCSYSRNIFIQGYELPNTIHSLDLTSSNLTRVISCSILNSLTMKVLLLNNNAIAQIDDNAFNLPALTRLDLSDNLLEYISDDLFSRVKKLEYLNLANNRFTTFAKLPFHPLSELQEIILDNNHIGPSLEHKNLFDRSGYGLTKKIKSLSISGIGLDYVPDNFFVDPYDIRKIDISNNSLKDVFELPSTLEYLDLSDNPIEEIESEDFFTVPFIKVLKLNNIAITEVPPFAFHYITCLTELELERNMNLTEFSPLAFGKEVYHIPMDFLVERISLKGSRLTELDGDLLELFGLLAHLDLQGNPWHCDCNLVWLKQLQIDDKYNEHLRCATPRPLYNAKIFDLAPKYFVCAPKSHQVGITVSIVAISLTLFSIAIWVCMFIPKRHNMNEWFRNIYTPSSEYTMLPVPRSTTNF